MGDNGLGIILKPLILLPLNLKTLKMSFLYWFFKDKSN